MNGKKLTTNKARNNILKLRKSDSSGNKQDSSFAKEEDTRELWCGDVEEQDVDSASKHGTTICCTSSSESSSASPAAAYGTNICASNFSSLSTSSNVAAVSPGSVQGQFRGESTNLALEQYPRMDCLADAIAEELTSDEKGSVNEVRWPWELEGESQEEGWE